MRAARSQLIDRFCHWAEQAGATIEVVDDEAGATQAIAALTEQLKAARVVATEAAKPFAPSKAIVRGALADVADADLGISVALLGVCETGSVLLGSNLLEDRLVAMLTRTHVVVLRESQLVASLDDAAPDLRRRTAPGGDQLRYVGFISGPSRTADIERVLTIGVQGPRALHVVLIEAS